MRWLAATLALLGASAALVVAVYLRDRDPSDWLPPPRVAASQDAVTIMREIRCPSALCAYQVAAGARPDHWMTRISIGSAVKCFAINLLAFDVTATHGLTGTSPVPCDSVRAQWGRSTPEPPPDTDPAA